MEELLQQLADETGVPADLLERAAAARATADGSSTEAIVAAWTGGEVAAPAAAEPAAAPPAPEPAAAPPPPTPAPPTETPAVAAPAASAEDALQQTADRTGVPTDLLERAAAARAAADGTSSDAVVAGWTGGEAPAAPAAAAPPAAVPEPAAAPAAPAAPAPAPPPPPAAPSVTPSPIVEVLPPAEPAPAAEVVDEEGAELAEELEPAASVLSGFPRWLAASFVILPLIAVLYALLTPDAPDCGAAGQLAIDPVTGVAENCDGTPYGVEVINFFSIGETIYENRCASCHGNEGDGGVGPAMASGVVLVTFPTCGEHVSWVGIGSDAWPDATYGATNTPVGASGAAMPGFEDVLTPEELAAVVLYERVQFGAEALPDAEAGCGLADDEVLAAG